MAAKEDTDSIDNIEIVDESDQKATVMDTAVCVSERDDSTEEPDDICQFYLEGKCRFGEQCRKVHPENMEDKESPKAKKKQKKTKQKPREEPVVKKKPPMKTAGDVRDRIMWDPDLPEAYFALGYVDRFAGLVERPFTSFLWGDLCDAGPDDLAIPQHCMSYFKYKGTKVWDKPTRLDHVFGSAGNTMKITEKMAEIDKELQRKLEERNSDEDSDDSDTECFGVQLAGNSGVLGMGAEIRKSCQEPPLRASHFLCIRITDPSVVEEAMKVQEAVYMEDPTLRGCVMPNELFHVTLSMIKCETMTSIDRVEEMLDRFRPKLEELVTKKSSDSQKCQRSLLASGLSTFGSRVLFVKLKVPESFLEAVELFQEEIRTMEDVIVTNQFEYVPHMTLIKVNRPTQKKRRSKYMNSNLYDTYLNHRFGVIRFDNIHFCSIDESRGADGFYQTEKCISF